MGKTVREIDGIKIASEQKTFYRGMFEKRQKLGIMSDR